MSVRSLGLAVIANAAMASAAATQSERALPAPTVVAAEPFSRVTSVRELRDGRVLVVDAVEREVVLLTSTLDGARRIGAQGRGPLELLNPIRLYSGRSDTSYVFDEGNIRYLTITGDGRAVATWRPIVGSAGDASDVFAAAAGSDTLGGIYFQVAVGAEPVADARAREERFAVVRLTLATGKVDTVARLGGRYFGISSQSTALGASPRHPLAPRDVWGVAPDGSVRVARHADYSLELANRNGQRRALGRIPFTPVRVGDPERRAESTRRERTAARGRSIIVHNSGPGTPMSEVAIAPRGGRTRLAPITSWPEFAPPFRALGDVLWIGPGGSLWIQRIEGGEPQGVRFDVVDGAGKFRFAVRVAADRRVVGISERWVYTVRADEDDLEYLQRHPLPN